MPKRSTATYTSEDAPASEEAPLYVYYCRYSGEHCLITDAALSALPRRRTDNAAVLDTETAVVRLQATQAPPKYIKRCVAPHTVALVLRCDCACAHACLCRSVRATRRAPYRAAAGCARTDP